MPKGLQIIAIPCNQFGKQEPGTAAEIKAFVFGQVANPRDLKLTRDLQGKTNFTLLEKSDVNGPNTHPIFKLAKDKFAGDTTWNFADMLLFDKEGALLARHSASTREPLEGPMIREMVAKL